MEKQTKITYILFGLAIVSVVLHNVIFACFKIEEPVFFTLTLIFFFSFVISVIYNIISYIKKGEPRDLWKLGWIGLFGFLGLIGGAVFYSLFSLFGLLGIKKWKWSLISFILGILSILAVVSFYVIITDLVPAITRYMQRSGEFILNITGIASLFLPIFAFFSAIIGFIKKGNKIFSFLGIILVFFAILFMWFFLVRSPDQQPRVPYRVTKVKSTVSAMRIAAEIYYDRDNTYLGLEKCPDIIKVKNEVEENKGENFSLNVNPDGTQYCAEVFIPDIKRWFCADSDGSANEYLDNPDCSSDYYLCD